MLPPNEKGDHRVALLGRQEPSVAERPLDQRRERRGIGARYPALRVPREPRRRLADELGARRVLTRDDAPGR